MQKLLLALVAGSASAFVAPLAKPAPATAVAESKADLKELATSLNPVVGYWGARVCIPNPAGVRDASGEQCNRT